MTVLHRTQAAQSIHDQERIRRLCSLSSADSWEIYSDLCNAWERNTNKQGIERLEQRRIGYLLRLRSKLDTISRGKRDGHTA